MNPELQRRTAWVLLITAAATVAVSALSGSPVMVVAGTSGMIGSIFLLKARVRTPEEAEYARNFLLPIGIAVIGVLVICSIVIDSQRVFSLFSLAVLGLLLAATLAMRWNFKKRG